MNELISYSNQNLNIKNRELLVFRFFSIIINVKGDNVPLLMNCKTQSITQVSNQQAKIIRIKSITNQNAGHSKKKIT